MLKEKPLNITANRTALEMTIEWGDGHRSIYPFSLLRAACPCAQCRGGHEKMSSEPDPEVFHVTLEDSPATRLVNVRATGSYGITLVWDDGHDYGIYNWHYLRALCPCPACRKGKPKE
ncbi:MAG: DUF971 domain-containing protein [Anaerolineae bacterium]|nr:MAG: DUF971 domain-containing protein [Anaerolineae bacterium]